MPPFDLSRRLAVEALGTCILVATVVGSGIMAQTLTTDIAIALLANAVATGAILVVLISVFGPISGAHFNPVVSMAFALKGDLPAREGIRYALAQVGGAVVGAVAAHAMFGLPLLQASQKIRTGGAQWFSESVAAFCLVLTILVGAQIARAALPRLVGLTILAAYWFTASTSFANPAVAIARGLTDTFAGIRPIDVPGFILAEVVGALCALTFTMWLLRPARGHAPA